MPIDTLGECVSVSSPLWHDTKNGFLLWQGPDVNDILFSPASPVLAIDPTSKMFSAGATLFQDGTGKLTGGSVSFSVDTAAVAGKDLAALQAEWKALVQDPKNTSNPPPRNPVFRSLVTQDAHATLVIDPLWGKWSAPEAEADAGTPGGLLAFDISLTDKGAEAFAQILKGHGAGAPAPVPGTLIIIYKYRRLVPECKVHVGIHGTKLFQALSAALDASVQGYYYGGSVALRGAWQKAVDEGAIEIQWIGTPPAGIGIDPDKLLTQFLQESLKYFYETLFRPAPTAELAKPGTTHGAFGGANFALNWTDASQATDLNCDMSFSGATWLTERMDATLAALFSNLTERYAFTVQAQSEVSVMALLTGGKYLDGGTVAVFPTVDGRPRNELGPFAATEANPQPPPIVQKYYADDPRTLQTSTSFECVFSSADSMPTLSVQSQASGPAASTQLINAKYFLRSLTVDLRIVDAHGKVIPDTDPANDYLDLNVHFAGSTLPTVGARLTTRQSQTIYWTRLADGTDPVQLTVDAFGQLQDAAVSQEGLYLPTNDSKITLFYQVGVGLSTRPALVSPAATPPVGLVFTPGPSLKDAINEHRALLLAAETAGKPT